MCATHWSHPWKDPESHVTAASQRATSNQNLLRFPPQLAPPPRCRLDKIVEAEATHRTCEFDTHQPTGANMPVPRKAGRKSNAGVEEKLPPYEPNIPEPTTRSDFMSHWFPLTLDDKTAQKLLWISEGGSKVARSADAVCPYPNRPERYEHSPQVLCKEGLLGCRGYWEVNFEGWVVVGVVAESAPRKGNEGPSGLGENDRSWGVGWSGSCYQVWHNSENTDILLPLTPVIGVYVDQPAGIIKFLLVEEDGEMRLLHKFKVNVQDKLFPGVWVGANSNCVLRKKEQ
ncbi:tripartite motif-containing protein 16 [Synchiropus splendidus]|uniref:tripartite motif-containing protein 16 n=1 Tax=Synchiropus splendidus TaxID=270530 RepID=UPI00237E7A4B|nr:tripartite motif-containing protein 16 [Synchiropus splendidus]